MYSTAPATCWTSIVGSTDEVAAEDAATATPDVLDELRRRVEGQLDIATRQELVRLLVRRIVVDTKIDDRGRKSAAIRIEYRFPAPDLGVVPTHAGTGSLRRHSIKCHE